MSGLPKHLHQPYRREQFVVLAYWPSPGWWRREGDYDSVDAAQRVADAHNDQGRAVIVARQVVQYGGLEVLTGASGEPTPADGLVQE